MTLTISKFRRLLPLLPVLAVTVFTVACAPLTVPPQSEYPVGRGRLVLPPGAWQDLGPVSYTHLTLPTTPYV